MKKALIITVLVSILACFFCSIYSDKNIQQDSIVQNDVMEKKQKIQLLYKDNLINTFAIVFKYPEKDAKKLENPEYLKFVKELKAKVLELDGKEGLGYTIQAIRKMLLDKNITAELRITGDYTL